MNKIWAFKWDEKTDLKIVESWLHVPIVSSLYLYLIMTFVWCIREHFLKAISLTTYERHEQRTTNPNKCYSWTFVKCQSSFARSSIPIWVCMERAHTAFYKGAYLLWLLQVVFTFNYVFLTLVPRPLLLARRCYCLFFIVQGVETWWSMWMAWRFYL